MPSNLFLALVTIFSNSLKTDKMLLGNLSVVAKISLTHPNWADLKGLNS